MGRIITTEIFLQRVKAIFGTAYDFSLVNYIAAKKKVIVICPIHGKIEITPDTLSSGGGCKRCGNMGARVTKEEWINRFVKKHGDTIDYSLLPDSFRNRDLLSFICKRHGVFKQAPYVHVKCGCPKCGFERSAKHSMENPTGWNFSLWEEAARKSNKFDSFKVYVIKCWNDKELFYKIGKTYHTLKLRFRSGEKTKMPYSYSIHDFWEFESARATSIFECELKRVNKKYKYNPKIFFKGESECFSKVYLSKSKILTTTKEARATTGFATLKENK